MTAIECAKQIWRTASLAAIAAVLSCPLAAQEAQQAADAAASPGYNSITAVRINPVKDRLARIEGCVIRLIHAAPGSSGEYVLQDDSGRILRVLAEGELPVMGKSLVVEGSVDFVHAPDREVVLKETSRSEPSEPPAEELRLPPAGSNGGTGEADDTSGAQSAARSDGGIVAIAAGAALLLIAGGAAAAFFLAGLSRKPPAEAAPAIAVPKEAGEEIEEGKLAEEPASEQEEPAAEAEEPATEEAPPVRAVADDRDEVAGEIVRTFYPLPGREKTLPGRLELVGGENDLRELYLRLPKDSKKNSFSFGSTESTEFGHFQVNHDSVAENHAKIVFSDDVFELINYSIENPTRINSRELEDGERIALNPGDLIEMGALEMVFHTDDEEEPPPGLPDSQTEEQTEPQEEGELEQNPET